MTEPKLAIFDLDGTLFRGDEAIPGACEAIDRLRRRGVLIRYLTNNSSQTRGAFVEKLRRLGFVAELDEVFNSGFGVGIHLKDTGVQSAFVLGEQGLKDTLSEAGLNCDAERAGAVVAGIDRGLTYARLDQALQHLREGAKFFATNTDSTYPLENGRVAPGAGATVGALAGCSGQVPVVVGKPEPFLVELILKRAGVSSSDALMVGDRYETDIVAGQRAGCRTLLVLTGVAESAPEGQEWLPSVADMA